MLDEIYKIFTAALYARFYRHINFELYKPADILEWMTMIRNGVKWISFFFEKYEINFFDICYCPVQFRALLGKKNGFVSFIKSQLYTYNIGSASCTSQLASLEICMSNLKLLLLPNKCKNFLWEMWASKLPINKKQICFFCNKLIFTNLIKCEYILNIIHNIIKNYIYTY